MRFIASLYAAIIIAAITIVPVPALAGDASVTGALVQKLRDKGVLSDADLTELMRPAQPTDDQALNRRLIRKLYEKGVLDGESYAELDGMATTATAVAHAEPQASPAKPAGAAASDRPLDKTITAVEEGFAKLSGDTVKMRIGAFIQAGYLNDDGGQSVPVPPTTNISTTSENQFFVRRARLFFTGEITPKLGFRISTEFAPTSTILQDAYIWADYIPYAKLTLGQMKQPFGLENVESLADNPAINRSLVSNMVVNDSIKDTSGTKSTTLRDMGVTLSGSYKDKLFGLPVGASYTVGVFNGPGRNITDDNNDKDIIGRLTVNPFVPGLWVGGSFANGRTRHAFKPYVIDEDRDRWAAELDYNPAFAKGLKLRGEAMWDRRYFSSYAATKIYTTKLPDEPLSPANMALWGYRRHTHTFGWYVLGSYRVDGLAGALGFLNGFEPVLRYDYLDEDTSTINSFTRDDARTRVTVGLNYYINKYVRLMADYEYIHADGGLKMKSLQPIDNIGHNLFTTLMQLKF